MDDKQNQLLELKGLLGSCLLNVLCQLPASVFNNVDGFDANILRDVRNLFQDIDLEHRNSSSDMIISLQAKENETLKLQADNLFDDDQPFIDENFSSFSNVGDILSFKSDVEKSQANLVFDSFSDFSLENVEIENVLDNEEKRNSTLNNVTSDRVEANLPVDDISNIFFLFDSTQPGSFQQQQEPTLLPSPPANDNNDIIESSGEHNDPSQRQDENVEQKSLRSQANVRSFVSETCYFNFIL